MSSALLFIGIFGPTFQKNRRGLSVVISDENQAQNGRPGFGEPPTPGYDPCMLCPRRCGSLRSRPLNGARAPYCGETSTLRVAYAGPHFGEEPPFSGTKGSGTIFFSGCPLRCSYCQNHQIAHHRLGSPVGLPELYRKVADMIDNLGVHNVNMVTPDHFFPDVFRLVRMLREEGRDIPVIFNLSGYQSAKILKEAEPFVDIYLPDFKYADRKLAARLSRCGNYPEIALELGFEHLFVQFPEAGNRGETDLNPFLPDFGNENPFRNEIPTIR